MPRSEADDEHGREGGADGGTERVNADGEAAFLGGEPFGNRLGRGGPVARFAEAEEEAANAEGRGGAREAGEDIGDGPPADEDRQAYADAKAVHDFAREDERDGVGDEEGVEDGSVVFVGKVELFLNGGREDREGLTVDVVKDGREKDQADDPPAEVWDFFHWGRGGG